MYQTDNDAEPVDSGTSLILDDVQSRVRGMLQEAREFDQSTRQKFRELATAYYLGKPFGNEEDGRSKVIMTELRDSVHGMLPSLLRMFFGPEGSVEFRPRTADAIELAEQQTDYVNYVFTEDNPGFLTMHSVLEDALVRRMGVLKIWWEEAIRFESRRYSGLDQDGLNLLAEDESVELADVTETAPGVFSAETRIRISDGRVVVESVPRGEFVYNPSARSKKDAILLAHVTEKTRAELIALGYTAEQLDEAGNSGSDPLNDQLEESIRDPDAATTEQDSAEEQENAPILYCEAYVKLADDPDGEGDEAIAELRQICAIGPNYTVVRNTPCFEAPFVLFCPYPLAHSIEGLSVADLTMDLQLISSNIARAILDSLSLALVPRTEAVEGMVNMQDLMNTEVGGIIRVRQPGMLREITHRFVGADALPVMQSLVSDVKEERTGRTKVSEGLNSQSLQSTTREAVQQTFSAARDRLDLVARIFAESFKDAFRMMYRLLKENQSQARLVRLRGKYVNVNPAESWGADPDVQVNVALGGGLAEDKLAMLSQVAAKQEQILTTLGPDNPLCGLKEYRHTLSLMTRLSGRRDVDAFWKPMDENPAPPPPQEPPPDPSILLAQGQLQLEQQKLQMTAQETQAKLALSAKKDEAEMLLKQEEIAFKREQAEQEHQREMERLSADIVLRREEIEAKYNISVSEADLRAQIEREKIASQEHIERSRPATVSVGGHKRKVELKRGEDGRIAAATITEEEPGRDIPVHRGED